MLNGKTILITGGTGSFGKNGISDVPSAGKTIEDLAGPHKQYR